MSVCTRLVQLLFIDGCKKSSSLLLTNSIQELPQPPNINPKRKDNFHPERILKSLSCARESNTQTIIYSSGNLSTLSREQFSRLRAVFKPCPIHVVIVFRHWVNFLPSRWRQNCDRRDAQPFSQFMQKLTDDPNRFDFQFDKMISNLANDAGTTATFASYELAASTEGVPFATLAACSVPKKILEQHNPNTIRNNVTAEKLPADVTQLFNGCYADQLGLNPNEMFESHRIHSAVREFFDFAPRLSNALNGSYHQLLSDIEEHIEESIATFSCVA